MDDYIAETQDHIRKVNEFCQAMGLDLLNRGQVHDNSKIADPTEVDGFIAMTTDARLSEMAYGSEEYRAVLREHKPTIEAHYAANDHHPEHFPNGLAGMTLPAVCEMLADWAAAATRMKDGGDLRMSILHNADRFGYDAAFAQILINTAEAFGMMPKEGTN